MNSSTKTGVWSSAYLLACLFGEVLVEVAQEPRVPLRVGEVVDERARVRVDRLEEARSRSPAASPLSQFGRSRIGLCSPKTSFVAA